jgi:ring-1,2-phenylacetyl-CoA epoxidase subunit PaaE
MNASTRFHDLTVAAVRAEAGEAVVIRFAVPDALRDVFAFEPGQFITLRADVNGADVRRSYSICSTPQRLAQSGFVEVGVRVVPNGVFSNWLATHVKAGSSLQVMPPDGRFVSKHPKALHRVGFAAGSGITPILSIMLHSLQTQAHSKFTLVYGNKNMASVMFNETLQDLKDRYPDRVTLVHVLSRQSQEADLLEGRIDTAKVQRLLASLLPAKSMDEVFVCGPEGMIETTCQALMDAGVTANRVHAERFASASTPATPRQANTASKHTEPAVALTLVLDGKTHHLRMNADERILDVALSAGLDLPHSCKGGVCCTCRAKVTQGSVAMEKNFTLEAWETAQGFVLSCQSKPTSAAVTLSFDER